MVINMKHIDYHYKHATLNSKDSIEKNMFELTNEYGYNFGSESKRNVNCDNLFKRPKNIINKEFLNTLK